VPQIEVATAGQTDVSTLIRYFTKDIGDEQEFVAATNAADWQPLALKEELRRNRAALAYRLRIVWLRGTAGPRPDWDQRQRTLPRGHDVRRLG
jgi:hypothetical protein